LIYSRIQHIVAETFLRRKIMASKKLKRAATVAAGIGAAYLASQALGKKKPTSAEAKGLKITRAKKFGESDEGQMARLDAAQQRGLDITRSKPFEASDEATPAMKENVPASKFLTTPGGMGRVTTERADEMMQGFGPMAKKGKFISKKMMSGGSVVARGNKLARSKPTKLF
jgi:hypothetical protein